MTWDTELEAMAGAVREIFGGEAVAEAYVRAITAAPASERAAEVARVSGVAIDAHTKIVDDGAIRSALRDELRRLLTRH
jgi:hypothetical protein